MKQKLTKKEITEKEAIEQIEQLLKKADFVDESYVDCVKVEILKKILEIALKATREIKQ